MYHTGASACIFQAEQVKYVNASQLSAGRASMSMRHAAVSHQGTSLKL